MICPKIIRIVLNGQTSSLEEQIVTGISDYIPQSLKVQQNINISIIGNQNQILNQILWNQFFSKSLIKQAYYFLMHHYSTQGRQTMASIFVKKDGKVHKIDEIMDWKSSLREALLKENTEVTCLQIEAFSNKGSIRKINIYLSRYPITIQKLHLILKTESIEVAKISKNEAVSQIAIQSQRFLEQTDRNNKKSQHNNTNKTKYSQISRISINTKQSHQSKQNRKQPLKTTPSKFSSKKTQNKSKLTQSIKDEPSKSIINSKDAIVSLTPQRNHINRQSVLAKILTSKQEQIILLKEQLQQKSYQYEILIRQQEQTHKKQIKNLTANVRQVLQSYSASQKEAANENIYLKERVKILQETIQKTNDKLESYTQEMETYVLHVRQLEEVNKRLTETNKKLTEEQDRNHNTQILEYNRMNSQILSWKQKAEDYRMKYEKIVDMMKNVINFS